MSTIIQAAEINGQPSYDDLRQLLRRAIFGENAERVDGWVSEFSAADAIVRVKDRWYRYPYTLKDGRVTVGAAVEVVQTWKDVVAARKADDAEG